MQKFNINQIKKAWKAYKTERVTVLKIGGKDVVAENIDMGRPIEATSARSVTLEEAFAIKGMGFPDFLSKCEKL